MPDIKTDDGCSIHVEVQGPQNSPVLMLSNSLGTNLHMWDDQVPAWSRHFGLVRYDRRGHGQSSVPKGPYPMERLGRVRSDRCIGHRQNELVRIVDGRHGRTVARRQCPGPHRQAYIVEHLIVFRRQNAVGGPAQDRARQGLAAIIDANMERWFTKEFRDRNPQAIARMSAMFLATKPEGYIGCGEGIRDMDHRPLLAKISAPTLVIAGKHDPATPLEANEFIRQHIPSAQIAVLDAAHIANVEQPQVYADTVLKFLLRN